MVVSPVAGCVVVAMESLLDKFALTLLSRLAAAHNSVENNVAHLSRECLRVAIDPRVVPRINPVDHAEQAHDGRARIEIEPAHPPQLFHKPKADAVILPLDARDFRAQAVL